VLERSPIGVAAGVVLLALLAFPVAADSANGPGAIDLPAVTAELPAAVPQVPQLPESVAGVPVPVKVKTSAPAQPSTPATSTGGGTNSTPASAPTATARSRGTTAPATTSSGARRTAAGGAGATGAGAAGAGAAPATPSAVRRVARLGSPSARPSGAIRDASTPLGTFGSFPLPLPVPDWSKPIILVLLLAIVALAVRWGLAARRARRLDEQRGALARDLTLLQSALVPEVPARVGRIGVSVAYRPADGPAAGGDFYDVFELDEARVAIILGDVSGHGRDAVSRAILMRYTLRAYVEAGLAPRAALELAGRVLGEGEDDEFATIAIAVHDSHAGTLSYATAGHPAPILIGARVRELPPVFESPPVGWGVPTGRRQTTVSMPPGALACFFTDGLTEARAGGEMLGRARLAEIVSGLEDEPTASTVLEQVREETEGADDDMAACLVQAGDPGSETGLRVEELEVDEAALAGSRAASFLEACGLAADEIDTLTETARAVAARSGTALVLVRLQATGTVASVTDPDRAPTSTVPGPRASSSAEGAALAAALT
jgi:serine phosphatase RsbU (regulator of sigma subunit)